MLIEKALLEDMEEILSLQKICYTSEAQIINDYTIEPLKQNLNSIKKDFQDKTFLKIVENNEIIGSIRAYKKEDTCYIGKVIIRPDFQNKGLGSRLLIAIEDLFNNCRRYELYTGIKSEKNIYLYQKHGYNIYKTDKLSDNISLVYLEKVK